MYISAVQPEIIRRVFEEISSGYHPSYFDEDLAEAERLRWEDEDQRRLMMPKNHVMT